MITPAIRVLGQRISLTAGIQSFGRENLIPFKNPRNLLRAFAVNAEVKNALDNRRGFLVQNPLVLVVRVAAVAVGRLAEMLAAGAALMQADTDFLGGIARIPLVEQRLFGKGKDKQAEIQYSCGFVAGWLPKS